MELSLSFTKKSFFKKKFWKIRAETTHISFFLDFQILLKREWVPVDRVHHQRKATPEVHLKGKLQIKGHLVHDQEGHVNQRERWGFARGKKWVNYTPWGKV